MAASRPPSGPRPVSASELQAIVHAERVGLPFFVYRGDDDAQRIVSFPAERSELAVGRSPIAELDIGWDREVSTLHAKLEQLAGELAIVDDGLSRNGSYVNGERVHGRRRLHDGDMLRFGRTVVLVRRPGSATRRGTVAAGEQLVAADLSDQQRNVLIALCRPFKDGSEFATPPTNRELADELYLSVAAVKVHLRALFEKFEVGDLPQNKKRLALVGRALQSGLISEHHLARDPARSPAQLTDR